MAVPPDLNATTLTRAVRYHWKLILAEGLVMTALGIGAILLPVFAGLALAVLLGWLLFASGVFSLLSTVFSPRMPGYWWSFFASLVTAGVGVALFAWPQSGLLSLTVALAAFLFVDGVLAVIVALEHRQHFTPKWGLLLAGGLVSIFLSFLIFVWLQQAAEWMIGTIVGIDLVISGLALAIIAVDAKDG